MCRKTYEFEIIWRAWTGEDFKAIILIESHSYSVAKMKAESNFQHIVSIRKIK